MSIEKVSRNEKPFEIIPHSAVKENENGADAQMVSHHGSNTQKTFCVSQQANRLN
jgi:hypothetical protein